ncbi:hypothetical protein B0T11DRAFT_294087 [Plectosphaerella cucumerina]|uniref:Uncharacterized protein n=1 Tax=Plectosphaerella cucumerina TaxID=40658 RepID=A0A8K0TUU7_9PEZI|nr:hypothetical protein B0T11DRAFT_294087 [Plectosphaerella cucumerina]
MLFLPAFLTLLGSVSAVDIWLNFQTTNCRGSGSVLCPGLEPNTCCSVPGRTGNPYTSVTVMHIPSVWNLDCRGHAGNYCGPIRELQTSNGRNTVCLGRGPFGGGGYGFWNGRVAATAESAAEGNCTRPSIVSLGDGTQYDVADLNDDDFNEMILLLTSSFHSFDIVEADGISDDVPEKFNINKLDEASLLPRYY